MPLDAGAAQLIALSRASGRPPVEQMGALAARAAISAAAPMLGGALADMAEVATHVIDGPGGPLSIRLYRPVAQQAGEATAALMFMHGGGWVVGSLDTHDALARALARSSGCVVAAVDYRLAPEHPFPAALADAAAALSWLVGNADQLNLDAKRIGIAGDSAGGNLAAVLSIMARDKELPPIALQLLLYPVCDLSMSHPSYQRNGADFLLTRDTMAFFISAYAGGQIIADDWRASPLKAIDLRGVAPALVLTAGHDPLCDEGDAYAARLIAAGVPTQHISLPGQIHGFLTAAAIVTEAGDIIEKIGAFTRHLMFDGTDASTPSLNRK